MQTQPRLSVKETKTAWVALSNSTHHTPVDASDAAQRAFVQQYTFALAMSQPRLSQDRRDLAYYTMDLYMAGELELTQFLGRIQRLFPDRVEVLSHMLRSKLSQHLKF